MAAEAYVSGHACKIKTIQGTPVDLPAEEWGFTAKGNNIDVSNSKDGRYRIPGLPDADGSFMLPYDSGNDPTVTANGGFVVGAIVVMNFYVNATKFWVGTIIVDEVGIGQKTQNQELQFPVKWSLQSGLLVPPTYP